MADENKIDIPEGVYTAASNPEYFQKEHAQPVADYQKRQEEAKDLYAPFNVKNHQQLSDLVKSNPLVAQQVVDAYVAKSDVTVKELAGTGVVQTPNAPQEGNITGTLDHSEDVAKKRHFDGENTSDVPVLGEEKEPVI